MLGQGFKKHCEEEGGRGREVNEMGGEKGQGGGAKGQGSDVEEGRGGGGGWGGEVAGVREGGGKILQDRNAEMGDLLQRFRSLGRNL